MKKAIIINFIALIIFTLCSSALAASKSELPAPDGNVINACYQKVNGQLRIVSGPGICRTDEFAISWNQVSSVSSASSGASGIVWRGPWSNITAYAINDAVSYQGSSYIASVNNTNLDPEANPETWSLLAQKGDTGLAGPTGAQGETGPQGFTGPVGPQGLAGPQGATGSQGAVGQAGPQGPAGPQGATGLQGIAGPAGPEGPAGPQGATGPQGIAGPAGFVASSTFSGSIGTIGVNATQFVFAGPTVNVTTTATQSITGAVQAPLGILPNFSPFCSGASTSSSCFAYFGYDLCYRAAGSSAVLTNFTGSAHSIGEVGAVTGRGSFTAAASLIPGAGTWQVGYCVLNSGLYPLNNNDILNGWILVTD